MKKDRWIAAMVCLNAMLLVGIVLATTRPRSALAQATGLAGNYMAVAGEIQDQFDALYIVDLKNHILHAFQFDRGQKQLEYVDSRDLRRDFRNDRK